MNRRGFLGACLLAAAAPAIVRADSLMKVIAHDTTVLTPRAGSLGRITYAVLYGDTGINTFMAMDLCEPGHLITVNTPIAVSDTVRRVEFFNADGLVLSSDLNVPRQANAGDFVQITYKVDLS